MTQDSALPIEIRRLWPIDRSAFRNHLLRLEAEGRHDRFGAGVSDDFLREYAERCFGRGDLVYGAFLHRQLRGVAELRSDKAIWTEQAPFARHIEAEAAFSVEANWRRKGVGETLFARVAQAAGNHGVEAIAINCHANNLPMLRLAAKFSAQMSFEEDQIAGRLIARRPTALSLLREAARDAADFAASAGDAQMRAFAAGRR